eukprot:scaffold23297_cov132-Cylindrotheca_fusiformis.AAC.2
MNPVTPQVIDDVTPNQTIPAGMKQGAKRSCVEVGRNSLGLKENLNLSHSWKQHGLVKLFISTAITLKSALSSHSLSY